MFWFLFWDNKSNSKNNNKNEKKEMNARIRKVKEIFEKYNKSCPALYLENNWHWITWVYCQAGNNEVNHSMTIWDFFWWWSVARYSRNKCFTKHHEKCPYRTNLPTWKWKYKTERNSKNNMIRNIEIEKIKREY